MTYPLVSALTPTFNRREFFPRAVKCFLAQDYPNLELIILDDGVEPIQDLLPADPRIKYFHESPKKHHGSKMNRCFELAQGEFCIVHDDDDWYPVNRITRQIIPLIENPALQVTGTSTLYYYQHGTQTAYRYTSPKGVCWLASIAARKSAWENNKFDNLQNGADYNFQRKTPVNARFDLNDPTLVVAAIHSQNACRKHLGNDYRPVPWTIVEELWQK
jgi:glycosyltransferase involved in cell wall biosynthesis